LAERLLTIVFTDVEGSTALHSAKGDAEAHRLLQACDELVRQQVQAHDGRALKSLGDGLMVTFESPRRAVACALAVQGALSERAQWQATVGLRIRVGIHTGEVTEEAGDLSGAAVNAAARIAARAKGGEVLVSEVVRQLCGAVSNVAFEDHGRVGLKGFPERWRLYLATSTVSAAAVPRGQRTPFVGRAPERAELRSLLDSALAGQGGLVMVGAEPGVGK
jgi:class 3 adenylate cyclase